MGDCRRPGENLMDLNTLKSCNMAYRRPASTASGDSAEFLAISGLVIPEKKASSRASPNKVGDKLSLITGFCFVGFRTDRWSLGS